MKHSDPGANGRLLGFFLEGVSRPQRFAEGLRLLAESLGVARAAVMVWDRRGHWACIRDAQQREQGWRLTTDDAPALRPQWRWLAATLEAGRWQQFRVVHDRSHETDSQDNGQKHTSMALRLTLHSGAEGLLLLTPLAHQALNPVALPARAGELITSLQGAMELMAQLRQLNHRLVCANLLLDAVRLPLLLLDASLRLIAANSHAQMMMERAATASGKRHITLRGVCKTKFSQAVRSACDLFPRTMGSMLQTGCGPVQQVLVLPILLRHPGKAERAALILVQAKAESPESQGVANQLLQQVYGMTPAEARLALLILDGQSPGDAANHLKVSVATVRTQLSSVLKKTGSRKQSELVRHLSPLMVLDQQTLGRHTL